jgi:hypothetical protein
MTGHHQHAMKGTGRQEFTTRIFDAGTLGLTLVEAYPYPGARAELQVTAVEHASLVDCALPMLRPYVAAQRVTLCVVNGEQEIDYDGALGMMRDRPVSLTFVTAPWPNVDAYEADRGTSSQQQQQQQQQPQPPQHFDPAAGG